MKRFLLTLLLLLLPSLAHAAFAFLQGTSSTSDLTTYTFSSQNTGTAAADRYIIVAIESRSATSGRTISTVTVGGESATQVVQQTNSTSGANVCGLYIVALPTGTSGDVVVTFSGGMARAAIQLYRADDLASATAVDTDNSVANAPSVTLTTAAGFAVGCVFSQNTTTASWANLTEDSEEAPEGTPCTSASATTSAGTVTPTCTIASPLNCVGVFASWEFAADASVINPLSDTLGPGNDPISQVLGP